MALRACVGRIRFAKKRFGAESRTLLIPQTIKCCGLGHSLTGKERSEGGTIDFPQMHNWPQGHHDYHGSKTNHPQCHPLDGTVASPAAHDFVEIISELLNNELASSFRQQFLFVLAAFLASGSSLQ